MNARAAAGYAGGLVALAAIVTAVFAVAGPRLGIADVRAACAGVVLAALVDALTFALHAYGMFVAPRRFLHAFGAGLAVKGAVFGGAIGWAWATSRCDARSLAIGCATGFVVLAHHEALVLCRISDRAAKAAAAGSHRS